MFFFVFFATSLTFNALLSQNCLLKSGYFIKELSRIQMKLHDTVLMDNQPVSYSLNEGPFVNGFISFG